MDVAWPDRRKDLVAALDVLAAEPGGHDARSPTLTDAVHWLVDDTTWDVHDPIKSIGTMLCDEEEAAALREVVGVVVVVSDRQGPTATDAAWYSDQLWPDVRRLAARALTAMNA